MILRAPRVAILAITLTLLAASPSFAREKPGTTQDVEKRLKAAPYPLVVNVHGGPSQISLSHWPSTHDFASGLSGMGYFVLFPNPRGSFGQGEAFTRPM